MLSINHKIRTAVEDDPKEAFEQYYKPAIGKWLMSVDMTAEKDFMNLLNDVKNIRVLGEETIGAGTDFTGEQRVCVLVDMVDGTDLLQRGFSNWCSAVVVFRPNNHRIEGSFVALADGTFYYATDTDGAFFAGKDGKQIKLNVSGKLKRLKEATICMNNQKSARLLKFMKLYSRNTRFKKWLDDNAAGAKSYASSVNEPPQGFRFYNLAGNPMLARVARGDVDAVIELVGQKPHDLIPGAFIAMKAGAVFGLVKERRILSQEKLTDLLLTPALTTVSYIVASTEHLYYEIFDLLQPVSRRGSLRAVKSKRR
jgi:fructose-1,6-bisphosphatase/inositol monophosphatase family enzyme